MYVNTRRKCFYAMPSNKQYCLDSSNLYIFICFFYTLPKLEFEFKMIHRIGTKLSNYKKFRLLNFMLPVKSS